MSRFFLRKPLSSNIFCIILDKVVRSQLLTNHRWHNVTVFLSKSSIRSLYRSKIPSFFFGQCAKRCINRKCFLLLLESTGNINPKSFFFCFISRKNNNYEKIFSLSNKNNLCPCAAEILWKRIHKENENNRMKKKRIVGII
jgi:hypothetical protein